jgi:two-component system sensor histidine kinase DesK
MSQTQVRALDRQAGAADCADRRGPRPFRGLWFDGRSPRGIAQTTGAFVWLAFILFPAVNAFARHGTALRHGLTIAGAAVFVAVYIALVLLWRAHRADRALNALFAVLVAIAVALTLSDGASWGFLFTYCAACAGLISRRLGFAGVLACSALAAVTSAVGGANGGQVIGWVASSAGIGMLIMVMRDLRIRNEELRGARAELTRLAVAQERERFARDLHDLLGHSLSVIALKAELAGRMLTDRPRDAATEVAELEQVARTALSEVREAVSGYRQPTLDGELAGARMALSAAGIEADVEGARVPLDPAIEAVLAWTVREGATNVIRHSAARRCTLRTTATLTDAGVEVIDDGTGRAGATAPASAAAAAGAAGNGVGVDRSIGAPAGGTGISVPAGGTGIGAPAGRGTGPGSPDSNGTATGVTTRTGLGNDSGGHGLAGLAERSRLVNGTIEAGALAGGGYRLAATVPISRA